MKRLKALLPFFVVLLVYTACPDAQKSPRPPNDQEQEDEPDPEPQPDIPILAPKPLTPENQQKLHTFGIPNIGNSCYFASTMQALDNLRFFNSSVEAAIKDLPRPLAPLTQRYIYFVKSLRSGKNIGEKSKRFEATLDFQGCGAQQDAGEYLVKLLEDFQANVPSLPIYKGLFGIETQTDIVEGDALISRSQASKGSPVEATIELNFPFDKSPAKITYSSLKALLDEAFKEEKVPEGWKEEKQEGDTVVKIPHPDAIRKHYIKSSAAIIPIYINHLIYTKTYQIAKLQRTYLRLPLNNLNFDAYQSKDSPKGPRYSLSSIVMHSGGANGGHYIALVKNKRLGKWFIYNDSQVLELSEEDARTIVEKNGRYIGPHKQVFTFSLVFYEADLPFSAILPKIQSQAPQAK